MGRGGYDARDGPLSFCNSVSSCEDCKRGEKGWVYAVPCAGLADPHAWACEVFTETLVVFCESAELELGHGLFVRTRIHGGGGRQRQRQGQRRARLIQSATSPENPGNYHRLSFNYYPCPPCKSTTTTTGSASSTSASPIADPHIAHSPASDDDTTLVDRTALVDRLAPAFAAHHRTGKEFIRHAFIPVLHHTQQLHDAIHHDVFPRRAHGLTRLDHASLRFENAARRDMTAAQSVCDDTKACLPRPFPSLMTSPLPTALPRGPLRHSRRPRPPKRSPLPNIQDHHARPRCAMFLPYHAHI